MSAILKIYSDSGHTTEVAHTTMYATTMSSATAGATTITLASVTSWPTSGFIDIIDGTNGNEAIPYYGLSGNTINLLKPLAFNHPSSTTVNNWQYVLNIGDQTNGIPNDGSASTPVAANTATFYMYNSGDQTAQATTLQTSSASPSTTSGYADTQISVTSSSTGFSQTVTPGNITAGSTVQLWVTALIPSGQSIANNPQQCLINLSYSSI